MCKISRLRKLRKKAWGTITLYHGTTSEALLGVIESGFTYPGGYIDKTTNGTTDYDKNGERVPSLAQDGVYLCSEDELYFYLRESTSNSSVPSDLKVIIGTAFKVQVETDALMPDYDDLTGGYSKEWVEKAKEKLKQKGENPEEYWRQSLNRIGQVVHAGPIPVSSIEGVMFSRNMKTDGSVSNSEVDEIFEEVGLQYDTWMSFDEVVPKIKQFYDKIKSL